jgi:hypothetical protein
MLHAEIMVNGRPVSSVRIVNDGTGARGVELVGAGNYDVRLVTQPQRAGAPMRTVAVARVEGWDRSRPAHELVRAALAALAAPAATETLTAAARGEKG